MFAVLQITLRSLKFWFRLVTSRAAYELLSHRPKYFLFNNKNIYYLHPRLNKAFNT